MAQSDGITDRLFVVDGVPLRYLVIPKCGCTYVKNVLWHLKTGHPHPQPLRVHDDDGAFKRASGLGLCADDIAAEAHAFTVIRKPVDRFLSLYFDKIVGPGRQKFVPLAQTLIDRHGLIDQPRTTADHRQNLLITITWLHDNLANPGVLKNDAHWTPQVYRKNIMKACNLKLLMVDDLTAQLRFLLRDAIPEIDASLKVEQNRSTRQIPKSTVLTDEIRAGVNAVYAQDKTLYQRVAKAWASIDLSQPDGAQVPRYSALF